MRYFPVFMDLQEQDVLVVGGGKVAARKARLLLKSGARLRVAAQRLGAELQELARTRPVEHVAKEYSPVLLEGARLVFAATDEAELNHRVFRDAEQAGIPVNVVDDREYCRFISPAVVDRSPVQVAISTAGTAPVLARRLRGMIERLLPGGLGGVALAAGKMRQEVIGKIPPRGRRAFWEKLITEERLQRWSSQPIDMVRSEMRTQLRQQASRDSTGFVYLVGAGPGNPDLLTVRALQALGAADVVLYDRLVSPQVLDLARRDADLVYVGKEAGHHHVRQEEIHRIMLKEASSGRTVVRLKGGDAFIFGRGGEEIAVLRSAGISYEVVPGITAAIGCAAYAGIPLTHRDHAHAVTFITGHQAALDDQGRSTTDWGAIAGQGRTIVVYMGVNQAGTIKEQLKKAGISGDLPAAWIENGSRDNQRVIAGSVDSIPALAARVRKGAPGLLVIGQVAALASELGWFDYTPDVMDAA